jgi:hypothetical protein
VSPTEERTKLDELREAGAPLLELWRQEKKVKAAEQQQLLREVEVDAKTLKAETTQEVDTLAGFVFIFQIIVIIITNTAGLLNNKRVHVRREGIILQEELEQTEEEHQRLKDLQIASLKSIGGY